MVVGQAGQLGCDPEDSAGSAPAATTPALVVSVAIECEYQITNADDELVNTLSVGVCTTAEASDSASGNDPIAGQADAYSITVTNPNDYPANVSTVVIGFYDINGDEISESIETLPVIQVAPGNSVTGQYVDQPDGTTNAMVVSWSH